ncbi:MAG: flavodoxin family protein [Desulfobacterales bacterium]|nr:flavodoxin family protein [Desulfobacterales bacterium]
MQILAFNGSPRAKGNTSTIISSILEGAKAKGAETVEIRLHDIDLKGCMGCLKCRENPGKCSQKDDLSQYLEAIKTCTGIVIGCPIYMYHIAGQMKIMVDRFYSLYMSKEQPGEYESAVPAGKSYALVTSQGHPDPESYARPIRWLAGMTGSGLGFEEKGRIIHANSHDHPAKGMDNILKEAYEIGQKLVVNSK